MGTNKKTFDVELFIHAPTYGKEFIVAGHDMANCGYPLLEIQTVTLNVPIKNPIEAEIEMLDKKETSLVNEHLAKLHAIQQRKKDLLCLEVKDG